MAVVILPTKFVRQPAHATRIDRGNSLTNGMVFGGYPTGSVFYDAVSSQVSAASATVVARNTIDGNTAVSTEIRTTACAFPVYSTGLDKIAGAYSIFVEGSLLVNASEAAAIRSVEKDVTGDGIGINMDDTSVITNGFIYWANNGRRTNSNGDALGANSEQFRHRLMITGDGTTAKYYAKNALNRSVADTVLPNANTGRQTSISYGTGGGVSLVLAWNRVLGLNEFQALYFNPWQVFATPRPSSWAMTAAGGGGGGLPFFMQYDLLHGQIQQISGGYQ